MTSTTASERWFDGTSWELAVPPGWTQIYGRGRMTFQGQLPGHALSFSISKAIADTREESTLEAARSIAMNELLSFHRDPGRLRPLVVKAMLGSRHLLDTAGPLRHLVVHLWCRAKGADIMAVTAGVLKGHVLRTAEGDLTRSRGYLRSAEWRIYVDLTSPRKAEPGSDPGAIDVLGGLEFHDQQRAA